MLLLHQAGSLKIGEVVRYTITYTPSADRILPSPEFLFLRIKNTCAIALRAAFVHGPYNLSVAAYPSNFNPNEKFENPRRYGVPEFEPMLKAGGVWNCHLVVPDNIRQTAGEGSGTHGYFGKGPDGEGESVTWVVEVASQVVFSASAGVHYEVLLARDEKSLNLGSVMPVIGGQAQVPQPGRISDFQQSAGAAKNHAADPRGVFSRAIGVKIEDTAALWNTPELPGWDEHGHPRAKHRSAGAPVEPVAASGRPGETPPPKKQKKVHLVVLTHGLHSNLGADMLFMKESIDAGVRKAKADARARRAKEKAARQEPPDTPTQTGPPTNDATVVDVEEDDEDDEEVIVRGFSGNATKTERGIKYLGKRLANFVLSMTYPDQPCLPITTKVAADAITKPLKLASQKQDPEDKPVHKNSSILEASSTGTKRLYKITKISFIAHSLGGLVQTYAIAYLQKHSPQFFDLIEPVNFIAMASPLLGLNHENPLYVKFALDFGLVGRTGQDLGLTWRAPTIARSGWGAIVGNLGENAHKHIYGESQPESKPLLRILPTGPAHRALKKFRNRTVYSNVVNDGIVPLRTSCLLFLDWQGLGRVDKARREAGLVETVIGYGWAELTGANVTSPRIGPWKPEESETQDGSDTSGESTPVNAQGGAHEVPQPPSNATLEDDRQSLRSATSPYFEQGTAELQSLQTSSTTSHRFSGLFSFFRSEGTQTPPPPPPKQIKIYQRSQTLKTNSSSEPDSATSSKSKVTAGNELDIPEGLSAPPRTTFFESAGDLLNPKLPTIEYLIDPSKRPRTIFHDRVYHPSDIPPPPMKKRTPTSLSAFSRKSGSRASTFNQKTGESTPATPATPTIPFVASPKLDPSLSPRDDNSDTTRTSTEHDQDQSEIVDTSQMKVEERIARAYHRELSWRKVLVKIEPDAHNNIIVRRMFANAFGWPVVHHLVEAHFSDSAAARTRDENEPGRERAKNPSEPPDTHGIETRKRIPPEGDGARDAQAAVSKDEAGEARDEVRGLPGDRASSSSHAASEDNPLGLLLPSPASTRRAPRPHIDRVDSMTWSERDWADSGEDSDDEAVSNGRRSLETKKRNSLDRGKGAEQKWNWTEKIVGKGAASRSRSPKTPTDARAGSDALRVEVSEDGETVRGSEGLGAGETVKGQPGVDDEARAGDDGVTKV
ncbi:putative serine esterase-domain-containing protein [Cercophora newfieldiana]|uniref:Serine esterase-domain-containing protein n=1 Tax=Cercophora newfieldiana TaxID=92897 RepID=A0AA40CKB7_9PEZI|nr:putative serine esterase-domain-containing protein [Cercophora newfieldiana]